MQIRRKGGRGRNASGEKFQQLDSIAIVKATGDGFEHVDPQKESTAQEKKIGSGTTHRAREYARMGLDVDAEDVKAAEHYGVSVQEYRKALFKKHFEITDSNESESESSRGIKQEKQVKASAEKWLDDHAEEIVSELITV